MELYPLKFQPIYQYRIWGGEKLKTVLHKEYLGKNIGESWEISDVKGGETLVLDGDLKNFSLKQLIEKYKGDFIGNEVYSRFGNEFPLLIKFIDAKTPLSIQVHPGDAIAKERHNSFGKNEMWYIMEADDDAEIIVGFEKDTNKEEYSDYLKNNRVLEIMHHERVKTGDTYHIPTGRVHAIGAGVLLAEIQQTSDITYRIYDYDRVDAVTGEKRALHTEEAVDVLDYTASESYKTHYATKENVSNLLVHTPYFKTNFIKVDQEMQLDYANLDSFVIYICVVGHVSVEVNQKSYSLKAGETLLLPATTKAATLKGDTADLLEVYLTF